MQIVKEEKGKLMALSAEEKQFFSGTAARILRLLAEGEKYPKEIARQLKVDEQKVYYHVRCLEKRGFLKVSRREERGGALAKLYVLSSQAFFMRLGEFKETKRIPHEGFEPFVVNGMLDAKIIVGSPDPHGPEHARSRDVTFAVDLALFLGTFLTTSKYSVIEDKDAHQHDLNTNLIIIGGPVTNKITKMVNSKLPVRFDAKKNIVTRKKTYRQDECGFIVRADNPFAPGKKIIVLAGKRYSGTKAAVLAFMENFSDIKKKQFVVVEGLDNDGDGEIDSVKIIE